MAKKAAKSSVQEAIETSSGSLQSLTHDDSDDMASELIRQVNKELGIRVAYNLAIDDAPTNIKRWISTGSKQLDYVISNKRDGGVPEGRLIMIYGPPSIGKSHIAYQMARYTQSIGGLVVYIDTENATSVEHLAAMGIDVTKRFVFCEEHCTENVFKIMESTILKAKNIISKDIPILIVWDSVAATSPKQELDGEYDKDTIGLNARVISKGLRKIIGVIGQNNVTLLALNQTRTKVGFVMGDPTMVPGGAALPYHSSVTVRLTGGQKIKGPGGNVTGIQVKATIVKNKVARPFRAVSFNIIFGKGIVEGEHIFDLLRKSCESKPIIIKDKTYVIEGTGAWKRFAVIDNNGEVIIDKKFQKSTFDELFTETETAAYINDMMEFVMTDASGLTEAGEDE